MTGVDFRVFGTSGSMGYVAPKYLRSDSKVTQGYKKSGIANETGIFTFYRSIFVSVDPRLLCNLYEPWTCSFQPVVCMWDLAQPEGPGSHMK